MAGKTTPVGPGAIIEVAPGRWKRVDGCSDRDRVAAALILGSVDALACEIEALLDRLQAVLGDEVVLPEWASAELQSLYEHGWDAAMPSIHAVRRVRDDLKRWLAELPTIARVA